MRSSALLVAAGLAVAAVTANASAFTSFIIRNGAGNVPPQILPNNVYVPGATEFVISAGSMKAGWGSSAVDGSTLGSISNLSITRHDNSTRFTAGTGPSVAPYFNIWITDGANFAVVANEPSNPSFAAFRTPGPNGGFTYSFSINDIAGETAKIYETIGGGTNNTWVHAALGMTNQPLTFANVLGFTVQAPTASYITAGGNGVGGGAPRELGTNIAYGVNWVFGDTLSNYVSGAEGYVVSNPGLVPTPSAAALLGLGSLAALRRRRR